MKMVGNCQTRVLVIESETSVMEQITGALNEAGYCCQCARDAQTAGDAVRAGTPDLILADINLAGHSGLTLCEKLKEEAGIADVPVMFLSSAQVPDIIRRSHAAGGTYYLRKPFDTSVLLQLVEKAMYVPHLTSA